MEIPWQMLSERVLEGVIKDYILREGTDYGEREYTLEEKIAQVKAALLKGKAQVVYDEKLETTTIVEKR